MWKILRAQFYAMTFLNLDHQTRKQQREVIFYGFRLGYIVGSDIILHNEFLWFYGDFFHTIAHSFSKSQLLWITLVSIVKDEL